MRIFIAALLGCLLALAARPAAAEDPYVEMTVDATTSSATIQGRLTLGGAPVADREVIGLIDNSEVARSRSGADGSFRLEAAVQLAAGAHVAHLQVEGSGTIATSDFTVSTAVELSATGPAEATNGQVVTISGRLTSGGVGLTGAGISLQDPSGDVAESYTVTGDDGSFQTMYLVPEEQPEGDLSVTLSFAGQGNYGSASTSVSLPVTHLDEQASASEQPTEASPSASAEIKPPAGDEGPGASKSPSATPTGSATSHAQPGMSWFTITVLALAALAVVAMVAIVIRLTAGSRNPEGEAVTSSLDLLDPDDGTTAADALFGDADDQPGASQDPADGGQPRRGLPPS